MAREKITVLNLLSCGTLPTFFENDYRSYRIILEVTVDL